MDKDKMVVGNTNEDRKNSSGEGEEDLNTDTVISQGAPNVLSLTPESADGESMEEILPVENCSEKTPLALDLLQTNDNKLGKSIASLSKSAKSLNSTLNLSNLGSKFSLVSDSGSVLTCHKVTYTISENIEFQMERKCIKRN